MNPELIKAVKDRLALGQSKEMIKEELRQTGYDESVTEQIIREAEAMSIPSLSDIGTVTLPEVGTLLSVGWAFAKRYVGIAGLLSLPMVVLVALTYFLGGGQQDVITDQTFIFGFSSIVLYIIYLLLVASALRIAVTDDGSRVVSLQEAWSWVKGNVFGLLWVSILGGLVVGGGFMLFLVPGIIVSIYIYFSQYVYALEGMRGMNALLRSRELVRGYWVALAGRLILVGFVFMAILIAFGAVLGTIVAIVGMGAWENSAWELATNLVGQVVNAFATLVGLKIGVELYRALVRVRPAGAVVPTEAKRKYVALAGFGGLFLLAFVALLVVFLPTTDRPLDSAAEDMINQSFKQRAVEMRNDQDLGEVQNESGLEEF
jgi:hypothetical protein